MKVIKEKYDYSTNIILKCKDKYIKFSYEGNLDLYWTIYSKNMNINNNIISDYFIITKENYGVYSLFEKLFNDIENINIFEDNFLLDKEREIINNKYRLYNYSNYNELYKSKDKIITWYSDETAHEVANILRIKKEKDTFKLEFSTQQQIEGYDNDFYSSQHIPIRFRNSGSSYYPFNIIFMKMYNEMQNIDDINDIGHQFYIEEFLYEKSKKLINKNY